MQEEIFTLKELAAFLKVSTKTVYRLAKRGGFPRACEILSIKRWRKSEIVEWLENTRNSDNQDG